MKTLTLNGWTALALFFLLASNVGWLTWHTQTVNEYELAIAQKNSALEAIQACLDKGLLFSSYPDRFGYQHVNCKLKNPGPIFKTYREYKLYVRELETAMGGG